MTREYLAKSMKKRITEGKRVDTLAKQMKASYAVALARHGESGMRGENIDLLQYQLPELRKEVKSLTQGEDPWYDVLGVWDQDTAADWATRSTLIGDLMISPDWIEGPKFKIQNWRRRNGQKTYLG